MPGISGITLLITGLTLALIRNVNFDFSFTNPTQMLIALLRVILPLGTAFLLFIVFGKNLFNSRAMRGFVLSDTQAATLSYHDTRAQLNALVNQTGIAITVLRPAGQVEIASERYDAMAEGGMIVSGEAIRVVDVSGNTLVVRKVR